MKSSRMLLVKGRGPLLAFLQAQYPETKRTALKQLLRHRAVFVNGNPVTRHDHMLETKDRVVIERGAPTPVRKSTVVMPEIVFEDRHIIVINKPEGLLTIATDKETHRTAYRQVMAYVQEDRPHRGERIFIVHRLDRDTSGLLVFARTEESKRTMQENWELAEKKYYAVVEGVPREAEGTIRSHLREHPKSLRMHSAPPSDESKLAITRYRTLRSSRHFALLEVKLETGRKNQIRAHLSEQKTPIVGDKKYDARSNPMKRVGLHAFYLAFVHPVSGKRLVFRTETPIEFDQLLNEDEKVGVGSRVSGFGNAKQSSSLKHRPRSGGVKQQSSFGKRRVRAGIAKGPDADTPAPPAGDKRRKKPQKNTRDIRKKGR